MFPASGAVPDTEGKQEIFAGGGRESVITESWQSYGGVKGIGRFCVTNSRNKQNKAGTGNANVSAASTAT